MEFLFNFTDKKSTHPHESSLDSIRCFREAQKTKIFLTDLFNGCHLRLKSSFIRGTNHLRFFMKPALIGLIVLCSSMACAAPLPSTINPAQFGAPTFEELWKTLDASEMTKKPKSPTRWRTVMGAGDPTKPEYRSGSGSSLYVDKTFAGVKDGAVQTGSLGLDPFTISPGNYLAIEGMKTPASVKGLAFDRSYLAGVLTTKFSFSQLFGYFEIKAKLPVGKGMWPAFWLMPIKGQWPVNGELDIIEGLGVSDEVWCSVHTSEVPKHRVQKVKLSFPVGGPGSEWHTYGAAWTADEIVWYADRKEVRRIPTPADMKQVPMYLILNLAIGGAWGGYPDASTPFPANFLIGRVSVWQLQF